MQRNQACGGLLIGEGCRGNTSSLSGNFTGHSTIKVLAGGKITSSKRRWEDTERIAKS